MRDTIVGDGVYLTHMMIQIWELRSPLLNIMFDRYLLFF